MASLLLIFFHFLSEFNHILVKLGPSLDHIHGQWTLILTKMKIVTPPSKNTPHTY